MAEEYNKQESVVALEQQQDQEEETQQQQVQQLAEEVAEAVLADDDVIKTTTPTPPPTPEPPSEAERELALELQVDPDRAYLSEDVLLKHLRRQARIVSLALEARASTPLSSGDLTLAYERRLFSPPTPPLRQENGTCAPDPHINFYPAFMVPEVLATYHLFFFNHKIPVSCRANRTRADSLLALREGAHLPEFPAMSEVSKIFEGLGDEEIAAEVKSLQESHSALVELSGDNPRLAVVKRTVSLSHFAYPAITLPPKVMDCVMEQLIMKKQKPQEDDAAPPEDEDLAVVSNDELAGWLKLAPGPEVPALLEERRKTLMAVTLVSVHLECMRRFFTEPQIIRKLGESLHYLFRHGYIKQACKISNVELTSLVSYLGILHENRLGQNVLHNTLEGEARRDYVRDTIYLFLLYTWQTAMGIWQQCLENTNLKELEKLLRRERRALWTGFDERTITQDLADIIFPQQLLATLQNGLPDFVSQSMMQNFRTFVLERSGLLPAVCNALPSDFVPIAYRECPPPLWGYTYLLQLANYLMYHNDVAEDVSGEGALLECYCRCNLCTPHRSLAVNTALLNETQSIGTFELQGPPGADGTPGRSLKLSAGLWTSAYLRKFVPEDYHAHSLRFYENQSKPRSQELTACVITQSSILAQLQEIKKAREEFLLKKGHGVYLDPQTGEQLNTSDASADANALTTAGSVRRCKTSDNLPALTQQRHGRPQGSQQLQGEGRSESRGSFRRGGKGGRRHANGAHQQRGGGVQRGGGELYGRGGLQQQRGAGRPGGSARGGPGKIAPGGAGGAEVCPADFGGPQSCLSASSCPIGAACSGGGTSCKLAGATGSEESQA
ncbi:100K [Bat mastadenovirus WIV11]|uniref:Shutoff protein n=1 Tax=Bat mastadenovirus WIV11 TaxID=1788433 RepID=A0A163HL39_9ADEN|nr:100K [Bat mastadenovirus WIV11]AMB43127.1 100K [Bat mastadenovirus WIV11]